MESPNQLRVPMGCLHGGRSFQGGWAFEAGRSTCESPPPDPAHRVLARLGELGIEAAGTSVDALLAAAYEPIVTADPTDP